MKGHSGGGLETATAETTLLYMWQNIQSNSTSIGSVGAMVCLICVSLQGWILCVKLEAETPNRTGFKVYFSIQQLTLADSVSAVTLRTPTNIPKGRVP